MSRNTEFQFVSTDAAEITNFLITVYENLTGVSVRPASPEKLFAQWVASVIIQERVYNNYTANQNIPSRAEGKNLDALAELYYLRSAHRQNLLTARNGLRSPRRRRSPSSSPRGRASQTPATP